MSTADSCTADASDSVDFIDEDDAGCCLASRLEQVADSSRPDANEHLDEFGTIDREERNTGFPGRCSRQQSFPGAGGANEQDAFRDLGPEPGKSGGFAEKIDNFLQVLFGCFESGNVFKASGFFTFLETTCRAANEATHHATSPEGVSRAAQHVPHQKYEQEWHQDPEKEVTEPDNGNGHRHDLHVASVQFLHQCRIADGVGWQHCVELFDQCAGHPFGRFVGNHLPATGENFTVERDHGDTVFLQLFVEERIGNSVAVVGGRAGPCEDRHEHSGNKKHQRHGAEVDPARVATGRASGLLRAGIAGLTRGITHESGVLMT